MCGRLVSGYKWSVWRGGHWIVVCREGWSLYMKGWSLVCMEEWSLDTIWRVNRAFAYDVTATTAILVHNENLLKLRTIMAAVSMAKGCMQTLYTSTLAAPGTTGGKPFRVPELTPRNYC